MARTIGIDLGLCNSVVSVWDASKQEAVIIPNLSGGRSTPSVVGVNAHGEIIVGEEASRGMRDLLASGYNIVVEQIQREMGNDSWIKLGGKDYDPQTITSFILGYLKQCAEAYLGEPVYDAVITCPAYFTELQRSATRQAGQMAGLNVHQLLTGSTAAAVAFSLSLRQAGRSKTYAVYELGGGAVDVSIVNISDEVVVLGTGGDSRLGGLEMDEAVVKWALVQVLKQKGIDLTSLPGSEAILHRLKWAAEPVKKALTTAESAVLSAPNLVMIDGKPFSVELSIGRAQFEALIQPLLDRSMTCLEGAMASAKQVNQIDWQDLDGFILAGGPTRLPKIYQLLGQTFRQHVPKQELEIRAELNPDEAVAMGAAIVAAGWAPFGCLPEYASAEKHAGRMSANDEQAPAVELHDVIGHSLGFAVEGSKFYRVIHKETPIPVKVAVPHFSNAADHIPQILVKIYQGEDDFVEANTKIGDLIIEGIDDELRGALDLEVEFAIDLGGALSTRCADLRTKKTYPIRIAYGNADRVRQEEERVPQLDLEQAPAPWRVYWINSLESLPGLNPVDKKLLLEAMTRFAESVKSASQEQIEKDAFLLLDGLMLVWGLQELPFIPKLKEFATPPIRLVSTIAPLYPTEPAPSLDIQQAPPAWRNFWLAAQDALPWVGYKARGRKLLEAMNKFAEAVRQGSEEEIDQSGFLLQDVLVEIGDLSKSP